MFKGVEPHRLWNFVKHYPTDYDVHHLYKTYPVGEIYRDPFGQGWENTTGVTWPEAAVKMLPWFAEDSTEGEGEGSHARLSFWINAHFKNPDRNPNDYLVD